jgi:hypothetical protein
MMADASTRVTGKVITGGWPTIIIGIAAGIEMITMTAITTGTNWLHKT